MSRPFKGKNGLSANDHRIQDVAAPTEPTDAATRGWSESQIRLNEFDPTLSYSSGAAVRYQGRIWFAAGAVPSGAWDPDQWTRQRSEIIWKTAVQNITAKDGEGLFYRPVGGNSFVITLPSNPVVSDQVIVYDMDGLASETPAVINSPGTVIENSSEFYRINTSRSFVKFVYNGSRWVAMESKHQKNQVLTGSGIAEPNETTWLYPTASMTVTIPTPTETAGPISYTIVDVNPARTAEVTIAVSGSPARTLFRGERLEIIRQGSNWRYVSSRDLISKVWRYTASNTFLNPGDRILVNTSTNSCTLALPSNPARDSEIRIVDSAGNARERTITIQRATGQTIQGQNSNLAINRNNADVTLVYDNGNWVVIEMQSSKRETQTWTASDGQTSFTANFPEEFHDLYINGIRLQRNADYTINTSSGSITLNYPTSNGDRVVYSAVVSLGIVDIN